MGQCHQTTLVTVTYPVINYILRTLAYIHSVYQTFRRYPTVLLISQASLEDITNLSSCFVWFPAFIPTLTQRLTSLYPSTNQHHD